MPELRLCADKTVPVHQTNVSFTKRKNRFVINTLNINLTLWRGAVGWPHPIEEAQDYPGLLRQLTGRTQPSAWIRSDEPEQQQGSGHSKQGPMAGM